ncbi:MAG: hypothetical protein IOC82_03310 [Aestuariivirga sp.]|nr:hypothetical protein [Aestuariivirga sp.]
MILVPLAISSAICAALVWLLLLLAGRYLGQRAVWAVGLLLSGLLLYAIVEMVITCSAPPEFVPPDCSDPAVCGDGKMIFACDGPGGALNYGFIYVFGPLMACLVLLLTFRVAKRPRQEKLES